MLPSGVEKLLSAAIWCGSVPSSFWCMLIRTDFVMFFCTSNLSQAYSMFNGRGGVLQEV